MSVDREGGRLLTLQPRVNWEGPVDNSYLFVLVHNNLGHGVDLAEITRVAFLMANFCDLLVSSGDLVRLKFWGNVLFKHDLSSFLQDCINSVVGKVIGVVEEIDILSRVILFDLLKI